MVFNARHFQQYFSSIVPVNFFWVYETGENHRPIAGHVPTHHDGMILASQINEKILPGCFLMMSLNQSINHSTYYLWYLLNSYLATIYSFRRNSSFKLTKYTIMLLVNHRSSVGGNVRLICFLTHTHTHFDITKSGNFTDIQTISSSQQ